MGIPRDLVVIVLPREIVVEIDTDQDHTARRVEIAAVWRVGQQIVGALANEQQAALGNLDLALLVVGKGKVATVAKPHGGTLVLRVADLDHRTDRGRNLVAVLPATMDLVGLAGEGPVAVPVDEASGECGHAASGPERRLGGLAFVGGRTT